MARSIDVDDVGIAVPADLSDPVDVLFDGQRVWSFNPAREHEHGGVKHGRVVWPRVLRERLDGHAHVALVDHATQASLHDQDVRFGTTDGRVSVVDGEGNPLAVDKGGRLQRDFSNTDSSARDEIMDALEQVIADLQEKCGLDVYLMYGCLLGAIRNGKMIGHDSDADVAYISAYTHPFDIIRECSHAIRVMRECGWKVVRMSGANFKVWVPLPDGRRCGIDVFGSFHIGDSFYVTGSLRGTLDRSALLPFGTVTLEGREIVAPAKPEEVLAFTYGPDWRVPDPAFHFDHDRADVRRMDAWFRSQRHRMRFWQDFYKSADARRVPTEQSLFAEWVEERLKDRGGRILDLGSGTGRDADYFARQGHEVTAFDYTSTGLARTRRQRTRDGLAVRERNLNLGDLHAVMVTAARFAHRAGTRHVYARGLLDTLSGLGRQNLWIFGSIALRGGGEMFLEFRTPRSRGEKKFFGVHPRTFLSPQQVVAEIEAHGGTVVEQVVGRDLAPLGAENPHICRLVVRFTP